MAIRPPPTFEAPLIEVRDGSRVVMLQPDEIDWVSAAETM
jgi:DNA-binding LytR/AlgR family response regulator